MAATPRRSILRPKSTSPGGSRKRVRIQSPLTSPTKVPKQTAMEDEEMKDVPDQIPNDAIDAVVNLTGRLTGLVRELHTQEEQQKFLASFLNACVRPIAKNTKIKEKHILLLPEVGDEQVLERGGHNLRPRTGRTEKPLDEESDEVASSGSESEVDTDDKPPPTTPRQSAKVSPQTPKGSPKQSPAQSPKQSPKQMVLVEGMTPDRWYRRQQDFVAVLNTGTIIKTVNNRLGRTNVDPQNVEKWEKFLFNEMCDRPGLIRVNAIMASAVKERAGQPRAELANRAEWLAANLSETGQSERSFLLKTSQFLRFKNVKSAFDTFQQQLTLVEVINAYVELVHTLNTPSSSEGVHLRLKLARAGFSAAQGRDYRTVIKEYYCSPKGLGMAPTTWDTMMRYGSPLHHLVDVFTVGVLLLLPDNAVKRLHRFGIASFREVIEQFNTNFPEFERICMALRDYVCVPLSRGDLKRFQNVQIRYGVKAGRGSMLECIEDTFESLRESMG